MPSYGLTDAGFVPKPLDQILSDISDELVSIFGAELSLDPDSPDGETFALYSGAAAEAWEALEEVVSMLSPANARGILLDQALALNGLSRLDELKSVVTATITGTPAAVILAGQIASTVPDANQFVLLADATIGGGGTVSAVFEAVESGPIIADAGTLTTIVTPFSGWDSVTNPAGATLGHLVEADPAARIRRTNSVAIGATNIHAATYAAIREIASVTGVKILNNVSGSADGDGLPAKSWRAIVEGGLDQAIADAIWAKGGLGIETSGTTSETVVDSEGVTQTVYFSRPVEVPIYVSMTIVTGANFPVDGDALIKQAIVDYAAGLLVESKDFGIGEDVEYSRLYTAINSIPGHSVTTLTIGIAPAPVGVVNVVISNLERSTFDVADMVVTT